MSTKEEHCKDCMDLLGKEFEAIHRWLDGVAHRYWPWMGHRAWRHHAEAVETIREFLGEEAATAAEIHIKADLGTVPSRKEIRKKYQFDKFRDFYDQYVGSQEPSEDIRI